MTGMKEGWVAVTGFLAVLVWQPTLPSLGKSGSWQAE